MIGSATNKNTALSGCGGLAATAAQTVQVTIDEARFQNCQVLQAFVSAPLSETLSCGVTLPPQVMPEISISLRDLKVPMRILSAIGKQLRRAGKTGAAPKADKGVPTWHVIVALDNALKSFLSGYNGLEHFAAEKPTQLLPGCGGHYEVDEGRWKAIVATGTEDAVSRDVLPQSLSDTRVLTIVSDQGSTMFAASIDLLYGEKPLRAVWC